MKEVLLSLIPMFCMILMLSASLTILVFALLCGWWELSLIGCFMLAYSVWLTHNETRK
jgi:hypothetical protein